MRMSFRREEMEKVMLVLFAVWKTNSFKQSFITPETGSDASFGRGYLVWQMFYMDMRGE